LASREFKVNVPKASGSADTSNDAVLRILSRNQNEIALILADVADGQTLMAASLRDVFDKLVAIEAKLGKK
jgi:hypothetical protein